MRARLLPVSATKALCTTSAPEHAWAHFRTARQGTWKRSPTDFCNISRTHTLACKHREQRSPLLLKGGSNVQKHSDPVLPDQAGRMMAVDPLGINSSPEEVKRKFNIPSARDDVVRQRAYEIYEQQGREEGHAFNHWLRAEHELK